MLISLINMYAYFPRIYLGVINNITIFVRYIIILQNVGFLYGFNMENVNMNICDKNSR